MEKKTKRLGFNFLRSYFDVLNEINNDPDKLSFLMSIINKQFLNEDPKDMSFLVNLCYQSQKHAVEKSVKGWITANKTNLQGNPILPLWGDPTPPPKGDPTPPPREVQVQVQEEVQEKEELINNIYKKFIDEVKNHLFDSRTESLYMRLKLRKKTLSPLLDDFKNHIIEENRVHKSTEEFFINFKNWLNTQDRIGKLDEYKTTKSKGAL